MELDRDAQASSIASLEHLHRYELQDLYLKLTREVLPAVARLKGWTLKEDHCFMRVILDQLFQDCWYNHLDRRLTAYKQLNDKQLVQAIQLATVIRSREFDTLEKWNRESLAWRGATD